MTAIQQAKRRQMAAQIVQLKHNAMTLGLLRTGRLLEIAEVEIGWELQDLPTPPTQKARQKDILNP